jgi:putative membrane protein
MMARLLSFVLAGVMGVLQSSGPVAGAAARLDDATILAIFDQANMADILTGRIAAKYGASEDVRALGRMVAAGKLGVK